MRNDRRGGNKDGHSTKPKSKVVAKAGNLVVRADPDGLIKIKSVVGQRMNALKDGKFAQLPTLLCNACSGRPEKLGGEGWCDPEVHTDGVYQKDSVCGLQHRHRKRLEQFDTRKVSTLQAIADEIILTLLIQYHTLTDQANRQNGIPDRIMQSTLTQLNEWFKTQRDLIMPRIGLKQTQIQDGQGGMIAMIREMYGNPDSMKQLNENSNQELDMGVKTQDEVMNSDILRLRREQDEDARDIL